jgi:hypothetical protein
MVNESSLAFTEDENKIRKRWLFFSIGLPNLILVCSMFFNLIFAMLSSDYMKLFWTFLVFLALMVSVYINYYCAYKNPGTKLLFLMIVGSSLSLLILPINLFDKEILDSMESSLIFSLMMFGMAFFNVALLYYSYKLRQINKKMKARKMERLAVVH